MQELRLVLILVGAVAIAMLLFHGLWSSRKESSSKFGKKVDTDFDSDEQEQPSSERIFTDSKQDATASKQRKEPAFGREEPAFSADPLFTNNSQSIDSSGDKPTNEDSTLESTDDNKHALEPLVTQPKATPVKTEPTAPQPTASCEPQDDELFATKTVIKSSDEMKAKPEVVPFSAIDNQDSEKNEIAEPVESKPKVEQEAEPKPAQPPEPAQKPEVKPKEDVIIVNVHGIGQARFEANRLFNSLENHDLFFGEMNIYHRHSDISGTGEVLFSVANMVAPGHFQVVDGEEFSTPGISFVLPLPCNGEAMENFSLMLQTAQQVCGELGGVTLDEKRNGLTLDKINEYKQRVKVFCH